MRDRPRPRVGPGRRLPAPALPPHPALSGDRPRCSNPPRGYGSPPQIRGLSSVHNLGTATLSKQRPQAEGLTLHQPSSPACGLVDDRSPQTVDEAGIHRPFTELSTGNPQAGRRCPQPSTASPQPCPLFGNSEQPVAASSESHHIKLPDRDVGKSRKSGDAAGENRPRAVGGVCRTSRPPQTPRVVHRGRPQGPWTKPPH
ncbi:hypothetical protein STXM2123_4648 [Streptomyces sp. F-3]|nr:hypothetical protein STXM2123_4648 [Streptomyces sp. F-3]